MSGRRAAILVGLVAIAVAGSVAVPALRGMVRTQDDVPLAVVERGDFVRRIHAEGNLKAADATPLGPPSRVRRPLKIAWLAKDGSAVETGDVVIRFDPTDLEEELRDGRHDAATTDTRIASKKVRGEGNLRNLDRDAEVADLELEYAERFQSKDALIFSRQKIIESEIDQDLAQQKKAHAERAGDDQQRLAQTELDLLAIERRKAEIKITQAAEVLQALEVRAPHDGIFVLREFWGRRPEVGQMVWRGNTVAEIPKPEKMDAEVFVLEADAGGLATGLPAKVTLDARPGSVYEATVKRVAALPQRRNFRVPIQYFAVVLELERTDRDVMKPGQRVQAVLSLDERDDVLTVPRQAVFEKDDKRVVYLSRGGGFEPVEVELGPAALGRLVIESGLAEGDRIALRDPTRPADAEGEDDASDGGSPLS